MTDGKNMLEGVFCSCCHRNCHSGDEVAHLPIISDGWGRCRARPPLLLYQHQHLLLILMINPAMDGLKTATLPHPKSSLVVLAKAANFTSLPMPIPPAEAINFSAANPSVATSNSSTDQKLCNLAGRGLLLARTQVATGQSRSLTTQTHTNFRKIIRTFNPAIPLRL